MIVLVVELVGASIASDGRIGWVVGAVWRQKVQSGTGGSEELVQEVCGTQYNKPSIVLGAASFEVDKFKLS
eukprot:scaffold5793_cov172-Skeletonema_marinoi.AAC.2